MARPSGWSGLLAIAMLTVGCGRDLSGTRGGNGGGGWEGIPTDAAGTADARRATDTARPTDGARPTDAAGTADAHRATDAAGTPDAHRATDAAGRLDAARAVDAGGATDAKGRIDASGHPDTPPLGRAGAVCAAGSACVSGFCVDGICCATACTGGCQSCSEPDALGTCVSVSAGTPPRQPSDCAETDVRGCGLDGTCDGAGACRLFQAGTICAIAGCSNNILTPASTCNGSGTCTPGATIDCAPYLCNAAACGGPCIQDAECISGSECKDGVCQRPPDEPCSSNGECASGFCADGVCCNVACTGPCVSCALPGRVGTCSPVDAGADPRALCVDDGQASCGHDGFCDGTGSCRFYPAGSTCAATTCTGDVWTNASTCDGAGACQPGLTGSCSPYGCDPQTNSCHTFCTTPDDCASGQPCASGSCGNPGPGRVCTVDSECSSGFCAQGVCCTSKCDGPCSSCALPGTLGTCEPVPPLDLPDGSVCP